MLPGHRQRPHTSALLRRNSSNESFFGKRCLFPYTTLSKCDLKNTTERKEMSTKSRELSRLEKSRFSIVSQNEIINFIVDASAIEVFFNEFNSATPLSKSFSQPADLPKRAPIARYSQQFPKDTTALSLYIRISKCPHICNWKRGSTDIRATRFTRKHAKGRKNM